MIKRILVLIAVLGLTAGASSLAPGADAPAKAPAAPAAVPSDAVEEFALVVIKTDKGNIVARLYPDKAPATVKNFVEYARAGHYDGTIFHRVIDGFMIQGGGFTADMKEKPTRPAIKNEAGNGLRNLRGTLAMARTSVVDSASSQFYINLVDNAFLDHKDTTPGGFGYAVFGEVVSGMDGKSTMPVVDAIGKVKTTTVKGMKDVPAEPVTILSVKVMSGMPGAGPGGMPGGMPGAAPGGMTGGMPGGAPRK
jgi:cyclophilin family peptidyl-prolyl cis-trans isomerase